jgi:putative ABC transport system permease protein
MMTELLARLRVLSSRRKPGDLDEELAFHIEQSTRANITAGMTEQEARRNAVIEFGAVDGTREQCYEQRPGWWMGTVAQDVRYALRGFRRNPLFTFTLLATLTLGIGATTAVFSVVDRILFRALPYAHEDRLISVGLTAPIVPQEFMLGSSYYTWRDNQKPFEALTSEIGANPCDLTERNSARLSCVGVEASFLPTLGVAPIVGRNFSSDEDRPNAPKVALISYALWQSHYARDPGILNRLIDLDGNQVRVIGVLPRVFEMPALENADVLLPQALNEGEQRRADPGRVMYAFARLKSGISAEQAKAMLDPVFQYSLSLAPAPFRKEVHLRVRSIRDRQVQDLRLAAWTLFGAVLAVLLIACANVAGLLMARAATRAREVAVRSVLGASRGRLVRQALTETLLLSLAGAACGCILAEILLRVFIAIAPAGIPNLLKAHLDLRIVLFTVLGSLVCGAMFGALPALERPRTAALGLRAPGSGGQAWLRRCLVAGQIAASMVLLTGAALLVRSFRNLEGQRVGLETRGVLAAYVELPRYRYNTPQKQMNFFLRAETALKRMPGADSVAVSDSLPPGGDHSENIFNNIAVAGRPRPASGTGGMVARRWITPAYFNTLGVPLLRGRNFSESARRSAESDVILSSLLASRLFGQQDPVGQHLQLEPDGPWFTVLGVAADVKNAGLSGDDEPEYYLLTRSVADHWAAHSVLTVKTSLAPAAVEPWMRAQIAGLDPTIPVDVQTLTEGVSKLADRPRFETALLGFFALCGLAMALIGLYGLISFIATQRTQEIGVRMALGASRGNILRLIAGEGVQLIAVGGVLGLAAALGLAQLLKSLLFNVGAHDPVSFAAVALLLGVVALAATLIPARAAMKIEPTVALRYE